MLGRAAGAGCAPPAHAGAASLPGRAAFLLVIHSEHSLGWDVFD